MAKKSISEKSEKSEKSMWGKIINQGVVCTLSAHNS